MEHRSLGNTGLSVSILGYGASPLGGVFASIDEREGIRAVHTALDAGINYIDVAPYYGLTRAETVLGQALSGIPRERYFLATKVGRYGENLFDFSPQRIERSIDESLTRLGVEYVDLLQCHDIEFTDLRYIIETTLPALQRLRERGKFRFIGITGLPLKIFQQVLARSEADTILSYCRYTLADSSLADLAPTLAERGIGIINASPLAMGLLSLRGAPAWHPADAAVKNACRKAAELCAARGYPIEKLAVQFAIRNRAIHTTLVGTASPAHIANNIQWASEPIDEELLAEVLALLEPIHNRTWIQGRTENN